MMLRPPSMTKGRQTDPVVYSGPHRIYGTGIGISGPITYKSHPAGKRVGSPTASRPVYPKPKK